MSDGDAKYAGEWVDDKRNGTGVMTYPQATGDNA